MSLDFDKIAAGINFDRIAAGLDALLSPRRQRVITWEGVTVPLPVGPGHTTEADFVRADLERLERTPGSRIVNDVGVCFIAWKGKLPPLQGVPKPGKPKVSTGWIRPQIEPTSAFNTRPVSSGGVIYAMREAGGGWRAVPLAVADASRPGFRAGERVWCLPGLFTITGRLTDRSPAGFAPAWDGWLLQEALAEAMFREDGWALVRFRGHHAAWHGPLEDQVRGELRRYLFGETP